MATVNSLIKKFDKDDFALIENNSDVECIKVSKEKFLEIIVYLREDKEMYFDYLTCISGVDNQEDGTFGVVYRLYSIPFDRHLDIIIEVNKTEKNELAEAISSISKYYRSANWMEREVYDMYGIPFEGHPDLRRILMPSDWIGYPLRKDYSTSEKYHGITIDFESEA